MGEHEGKSLDGERDAINERIVKHPDKSPGVSPDSGEAGESFNQARERIIGEVQKQAEDVHYNSTGQPREKVLTVTSGRALQIIDAWARKGQPASRSVDLQRMTADSEFSKPGQLFKLEKDGLKPVERITEPGQYFAHHGATERNGLTGETTGGRLGAEENRGQPKVDA